MLTFDFRNCMEDGVGRDHGLCEQDLNDAQPLLDRALTQLKRWHEDGVAGFLDLPSMNGVIDGISKEALRVRGDFENLVVLGIGGSALGLRCLAGALLHPFHNLLDREARGGLPRLFVCDNVDPDTFISLLDTLDLKKTCFNVISKSGGTTETQAQLALVLERLHVLLGDGWRNNVIVTTDPTAGELRKYVNAEKLKSLSVPSNVGGRFSVLSAVGLFPAACMGIDIFGLREGALLVTKTASSDDITLNAPLRLAATHYLLDHKRGKKISVMFPYCDGLSLFADWYVQLWAESLGKEGKGTTPLKAIGATDQHSQLQLFMEGPNDKVLTFLGVREPRTSRQKMTLKNLPANFNYLNGKTLGDVLHAEQHATADALRQAKRPNLTITLPTLNARSLGSLLMTFEIATAFAGALYDRSPFDQPGVELSKVLTKKILSAS
ncbi:MAG: glucose-6-phosphate isomerase [Deltaproteobacteria bacterium]|nr:glucose-6-phosphate isomerase [Deltaproteobacteria bacterium]